MPRHYWHAAPALTLLLLLVLLPFYSHYTGQPALAGEALEDSVGAKFFC